MKVEKSDFKRTELMSILNETFDISKKYTVDEMNIIINGVLPEGMDDRWFIYFDENQLFLHRSWTGHCIFIVDFHKIKNEYEAYQLTVCRDKKIYKSIDKTKDEELLFGIIDNIILKKYLL